MVGQDRLAEFQGLAQKYNGSELYNLRTSWFFLVDLVIQMLMMCLECLHLNLDLMQQKVTSMHSSRGVPNTLKTMQKRELYNTVRKQMKIKKILNFWEIAPKFDQESLRESYRNGEILISVIQKISTQVWLERLLVVELIILFV